MLMVPTNYKAKTLGDPFQQFVAKKNFGGLRGHRCFGD